jgi:hypothetical protein
MRLRKALHLSIPDVCFRARGGGEALSGGPAARAAPTV